MSRVAVPAPAYVGLGGNVGDVPGRFRAAARALSPLGAVRMSSVWRTAPVGPVRDQPWFWNACLELRFAGWAPTPRTLLTELRAVEEALGRDRGRETRQGPRPLDLDLLVWGDLVVDEPTLHVPHPRLAARVFALAPLVELGGPGLGIPWRGGGVRHAGELLRLATQDAAQATIMVPA